MRGQYCYSFEIDHNIDDINEASLVDKATVLHVHIFNYLHSVLD